MTCCLTVCCTEQDVEWLWIWGGGREGDGVDVWWEKWLNLEVQPDIGKAL